MYRFGYMYRRQRVVHYGNPGLESAAPAGRAGCSEPGENISAKSQLDPGLSAFDSSRLTCCFNLKLIFEGFHTQYSSIYLHRMVP